MAKVHYLQHVPFEGLESMEPALLAMGHELSCTQLFNGDALPTVATLDWLIVMGGPMSVHEDSRYPWLVREKAFIRECITANKPVLGICLGAQLIATTLGAAVYPQQQREIGWFPLKVTEKAASTAIGSVLNRSEEVFHWHGDTFDLPAGATLLASSEACKHQGFIWQDHVVALQFHLETTLASATALIEHCGNELDGSRYVQSADQILAGAQRFSQINTLMTKILGAIVEG